MIDGLTAITIWETPAARKLIAELSSLSVISLCGYTWIHAFPIIQRNDERTYPTIVGAHFESRPDNGYTRCTGRDCGWHKPANNTY